MKRCISLTLPLIFAAAAQAWQPAPDSMLTEWGANVTPDTAWHEYPRPALARDAWSNLNGLWKYQISSQSNAAPPDAWAGDILVPFAIESALSGVKKRITPDDALWYRRSFDAPAIRDDQRILLNFEAVDYQSTVWVNDTKVGSHTGGNLPFSFDITAALKRGANTLTVRVTDATDTPGAYQLHGKQVRKPRHLVHPGLRHLADGLARNRSRHPYHRGENHSLDLRQGRQSPCHLEPRLERRHRHRQPRRQSGRHRHRARRELTLTIPNPKLWSPDSPTLYDLTITLGSDKVKSYIGLRETTVIKDGEGHLRLALNGKPLFHLGTLDQGWWPDGLLTPPSDEAMRSDIEFLKAAGFNTMRKHIKVEPRRYYTHCDRIGMMVWQDQVSRHRTEARKGIVSPRGPGCSRIRWTPTWPDAAHQQYMAELKTMIDTLRNHPCIVQWVPFNEAWGQHRTLEVGKWAVAYDPTRQVNIASGGNFCPVGHIVDHHQYPHPGFPFELGENGRFDGFVKIVGEFGGHGFPVQGHLWNPNARNWGYGGLPKDKDEWLERYKTSIAKLAELKKQGIAAGIYTQTTDVEGEINGLITYDRKVRKMPPQTLAEIHKQAGLVP